MNIETDAQTEWNQGKVEKFEAVLTMIGSDSNAQNQSNCKKQGNGKVHSNGKMQRENLNTDRLRSCQ